jgi:uncharacterized cupredoxin-like copper-binding protein
MPAAIASAAGDLSRQPVSEITVSLGNEAGALKFFPKLLEFESGKRYKLVLKNPSWQKHYFTAKNFADASWTQKVEAGNVEIKGSIAVLKKVRYALCPMPYAHGGLCPMPTEAYALCPVVPHLCEKG